MILVIRVSEMRRGLSISLIVLLWLGPFVAVLTGIDETPLPFCCRRESPWCLPINEFQATFSEVSHAGIMRVLEPVLKLL